MPTIYQDVRMCRSAYMALVLGTIIFIPIYVAGTIVMTPSAVYYTLNKSCVTIFKFDLLPYLLINDSTR